jgi:hypothetical protein
MKGGGGWSEGRSERWKGEKERKLKVLPTPNIPVEQLTYPTDLWVGGSFCPGPLHLPLGLSQVIHGVLVVLPTPVHC